MIFNSIDENKEVLKKYVDVWAGIKNKIKAINNIGENDYEKDYMKMVDTSIWAKILPRHFLFQFKYLQNKKKVWLCRFMTFIYYLFWTFLPSFSRKFWLTHELLWFCQRGTKKFLKIYIFFKYIFFETTFFATYFKYTLCWSGKYDFFHLNSHFLVGIWKWIY